MFLKKISYPFIYLDSSALIRSDYNINNLSRKKILKEKNSHTEILKKITAISDYDNVYYTNICKLIEKKCISKLITYECLNSILCHNDSNKILLMSKKAINNDNIFIDNLVLWGEEISHSKFYEAAMTIADAQCIVIDKKFFSLSVGKRLANYITTKSSIFIIDDTVCPSNNISSTNIIPMSPVKFIEELTYQIN